RRRRHGPLPPAEIPRSPLSRRRRRRPGEPGSISSRTAGVTIIGNGSRRSRAPGLPRPEEHQMSKSLATAAAIMALLTAPALAWAQTTQDPHHPANQETAQPGTAGMMGGTDGQQAMPMMMNMMTNMMNMMSMMGRESGMMAIDHVEGRIAFLR